MPRQNRFEPFICGGWRLVISDWGGKESLNSRQVNPALPQNSQRPCLRSNCFLSPKRSGKQLQLPLHSLRKVKQFRVIGALRSARILRRLFTGGNFNTRLTEFSAVG
jgi:hypothetical protein